MTPKEIEEKRSSLAKKYRAPRCSVAVDQKVGIALNLKTGELPINGVRHRPEHGTTGWYLWGGETMSDDPDFFVPVHVAHLAAWCPDVLPYLELPPGWRFLIAPGHEDVWFDPDVDLSPTPEIERRGSEVDAGTADTMTLDEYREHVRARRAARTRG